MPYRYNGFRVKEVRVLLDSASQRNFLIYKIASDLGLQVTKGNHLLKGVSNISTSAIDESCLTLHSQNSSFHSQADALLLDNIVDNVPSTFFSTDNWDLPDASLADPTFNIPDSIYMLISLDLKKIKLKNEAIQLQHTMLGWIVVGTLNNKN